MVFQNSVDANQQGTQYLSTAGAWSGVDGGTAGHVLTSNGTGVAPSFQTLPTPLISSNAFMVFLTTQVSNVTGDGTLYPLLFDTTSFDHGGNITLNSGGHTIFTAPATGTYLFCGYFNFFWTPNAATNQSVEYELIDSSGPIYRVTEDGTNNNATEQVSGRSFSIIVPMTAANTINLRASVNGATGKNAAFRGIEAGITLNMWSGSRIS